MAQKIRYNISTGRISKALDEYTQSSNMRPIKGDSRKAAEIQKKLNEVEYISKTYSKNSFRTKRAYGSKGTLRIAKATSLSRRNRVALKVAAPNPPVSPPPFPNPSGSPVKKPKKKKGYTK